MLRKELANAKRRDDEYNTCLEAAHAQLVLVGMYAEACQQRAIAASKKKRGAKGRRLNGTGWGRVVSDRQLLKEIHRMDEEKQVLEREKQARRDARALKDAMAAQHREFMDARRDAWETVKAEFEELVQKWEHDGRRGEKPKRLKQQEVYSALGLDDEDSWYGIPNV